MAGGLRTAPGTFTPDAALINFYDDGAKMGMHQDKDERSDAPVVSLSIGDTCVFRFGNTETRGKPYTDVELRSGDLFVFGGAFALRLPRGPEDAAGTADEATGMTTGRLNLTLARDGARLAELDRALEVQAAADDRGLEGVQAGAVERERREAVALDADRVAGGLGVDDVADVLELADRGAVDLVDRVAEVEALLVGGRAGVDAEDDQRAEPWRPVVRGRSGSWPPVSGSSCQPT